MRILTLIFCLVLASSVVQAGTFKWNPEQRNHRSEIKARCLDLWAPSLQQVVICRVKQQVAMGKIVRLTKAIRESSPEEAILLKCASIWWEEKPDAVRLLGCYDQRKQALKRLLARR